MKLLLNCTYKGSRIKMAAVAYKLLYSHKFFLLPCSHPIHYVATLVYPPLPMFPLQVCFWLMENGLRVLIAGCDTFRAGAVEQLRTHTKHLNSLHPTQEDTPPKVCLSWFCHLCGELQGKKLCRNLPSVSFPTAIKLGYFLPKASHFVVYLYVTSPFTV